VLGTEICRRFASAGKPFRAMVRSTSDPAKKDVLNQLGGELIEADLKGSRAAAPGTKFDTTARCAPQKALCFLVADNEMNYAVWRRYKKAVEIFP
jgi:cysteine synthase